MRIMFIALNAARADHFSCYDYCRSTTPVIDSLAAAATIFSNCHVSALPEPAASNAIFQEGAETTKSDEEDGEEVHWVAQLRAHNWNTVFCAPDTKASGAGGSQWGFMRSIFPAEAGATAEQMAACIRDFLKSDGGRDQWLLYVQFSEPGIMDRVPAGYSERFLNEMVPEYPAAEQVAEDWRGGVGLGAAREMAQYGSDPWAAYTARLNAYDGALSYVDEQIGRIVETLENLKLLEQTVLVISANHGLAIGDMGQYFSEHNAAEAVTRVPLIIRWPGASDSGWIYDGLLYQYDLGATLLEKLQIPRPATPALSHAPAISGDPMQARKFLLLNYHGLCQQRATRTDRYRLIETLDAGPYPYPPHMLFDVNRDPQQSHNIAAEQEAVVAELLQQYGR